MKKGMCSLVIVIALAFAIPSHAQQTTTITVGQVNCGHATYPLNCYSVPLTINGVSGTAWFDVQGASTGFILFRPSLEGSNYVTAAVTSWAANSRNTIGQVTQATVTFTVVADPNNDSDSDTVQGSITLNFSYYYGGYGRTAGWYETLTGGSGAQSITRD